MLTLFGSKGSGSAAIECALRHCGVQYTIVRASTWEADSAQGELAKANPLGQIPTLVLEDGTVLTESAAILIHLGLQFPGSGLLPIDPSAREQVREADRRQLHRHWEIFADTFAATPFLSGARPGALDYLAAVVSKWSGTRPHLATHRPAFAETLQRIESDALVAAVFATHWDT